MKPVITILLIAFATMLQAFQDTTYKNWPLLDGEPIEEGQTIDVVAGDNITIIQDTLKLDTIDLNQQSKMIVKQITEQLQQIEETKRGLEEKLIILLTGAGIDPKKVAGFTPDFKILSRK